MASSIYDRKIISYKKIRIDVPTITDSNVHMRLHYENKVCVRIEFCVDVVNKGEIVLSYIDKCCDDYLICMREYTHLKEGGRI